MLAMIVSSFLTGLGGTFYAFYLFSLQPNSMFGIPLSVEIIIRPIVGGAGTLLGPILGSFILTPLGELSRLSLGHGGYHGLHLVAYGVLLVAVVLFLPQGPYPYLARVLRRFPRLTVVRNVMSGGLGRHPHPAVAEARSRAIVDELGLGAKADHLAGSLTLAERKRLELARALATEPVLLLLDEVMSGLGERETETLVREIRAINARGIAILLIEHVMRAVMSLAQRIVVLDGGERIAEGRPATAAIVAGGIAHVPEGRQLFPTMTVRENLELGARTPESRRRRPETLARVLELFPRLAERRRQLAGTLSGGEQQMTAIGRALMARPRLLLLDEPSLGLAPVVVAAIFENLARINRDGVAILLVEQNVTRALRFAQRTYVLENGTIALEGPSARLSADERIKRAYFGR